MKIGAVAKMTGLSPSGIRFLEEQGLLTPSGGRHGTYRSYSLSDVSSILDYRNYRKCGLTQEEIMKLFTETNEMFQSAIFEQHCDELERKLLETTRLLHFLRHRNQDLLNVRHADTFWEMTERPALICMHLSSETGEFVGWPADNGFEIPYADSVISFDSSRLTGSDEDVPPELNIGMLETDVLNTSFLGKSNIRYLEKHLAFHCIVEITDSFRITDDSLERSRSFIREAFHHYELVPEHDAITRRILTVRNEKGSSRYDHLWIDVKKISKAS